MSAMSDTAVDVDSRWGTAPLLVVLESVGVDLRNARCLPQFATITVQRSRQIKFPVSFRTVSVYLPATRN
jgi:hypothetical protein